MKRWLYIHTSLWSIFRTRGQLPKLWVIELWYIGVGGGWGCLINLYTTVRIKNCDLIGQLEPTVGSRDSFCVWYFLKKRYINLTWYFLNSQVILIYLFFGILFLFPQFFYPSKISFNRNTISNCIVILWSWSCTLY